MKLFRNYLSIALLFTACSVGDSLEQEKLPFKILGEIPAPLVSSDSLLVFEDLLILKNSPEPLLSLNKLVENESGIFILDKVSSRLSLFDKNGKYIRYFGQTGSGPGEYGVINDFFTVGELVYLFSPSDLSLYSYEINTGKFISKNPLKAFAQKIVPISDGEILVYVSNNPTDFNFNVYRFDLEGNLLAKYFPFDPKRSNSIVSYTGFLATYEGSYYCEPFGDRVYKFNSTTKDFDPIFELDFVSHDIRSDRENFEKYTGSYSLDPQNRVRFPGSTFLINDNWLVMDMTFDAKVQFILMSLKDPSNLFTLSRRVDNEFFRFVRNPLFLNSNDELIFPIDPESFQNYDGEKASIIMSNIFDQSEKISLDDDYYLVRVRLKR